MKRGGSRLGFARRALTSSALAFTVAGCGHTANRLPPAKPEAAHELAAGLRLVRLGPTNYARAIERFEAARAMDPRLWEASYDEGWVRAHMAQWSEAAQAYRRALDVAPDQAKAAEGLALAELTLGHPSAAARACRSMLDRLPAKDPAGRPLAVLLGAAQRKDGKLDAAADTLRAVLAEDPRSAPALVELALVYQARKNFELAELVLRRALEADGKSPAAAAAWNDLGLTLLQQRRDREALAAFESAAKLDPQLVAARLNLAGVYLDSGDYAAAEKELKEITRQQPDEVAGWVALGVAERGLGKLDDARKAYDEALRRSPDAPDAWYDVAVLTMDFRKDRPAARAPLERFLRAAPSDHPRRADAEQRLKDLQREAAAAVKAAGAPSSAAPAAPPPSAGGAK